jgi:hypothetical protein
LQSLRGATAPLSNGLAVVLDQVHTRQQRPQYLLLQWLAPRWSLLSRYTLTLIAAMELALLFTIRDNLTLNVIMLLFSIESIKTWQIGA